MKEKGKYGYLNSYMKSKLIAVIILSLDKPMLEQEEKLGAILANILSNYFV